MLARRPADTGLYRLKLCGQSLRRAITEGKDSTGHARRSAKERRVGILWWPQLRRLAHFSARLGAPMMGFDDEDVGDL
jgi:hypothetical protein